MLAVSRIFRDCESNMNKDDAVKVNDYIEKIIGLANDVLYIGNNCGDGESRKNIQRVLAVVVTELDLEILEPIYKQFPDLRPHEMEELK